MALTRLSCDALGDLDDGRARGIIDAALLTLYRDIEDRGHDEKTRELTIKISFVSKQGLVIIEAQAQAKVPPYISNLTTAKMLNQQAAGGVQPVLCFQEHDAENPDQQTMFDEQNDKKE